MKKIIIEVSEKYSDIITVTLIGGVGTEMIRTAINIANISEGTHFVVPENGVWVQSRARNYSER